jgi:Ca2+-binding RTX toxin-like protein
LYGEDGDDVIDAGADDDYIEGGKGNDTLLGGDGNDRLDEDGYGVKPGFGDDYMDGGAGNDTLFGGDGADSLLGGAGSDRLNGEVGDDFLNGGSGSDTLVGGAGADKFIFSESNPVGTSDVLVDFMASQGDQIVFDGAFFSQLQGKTDLTQHIRQYNDAGAGEDDFIVYDSATGNLYYDPTGSSNASAVLIANLQNKPLTMAANQFAVL